MFHLFLGKHFKCHHHVIKSHSESSRSLRVSKCLNSCWWHCQISSSLLSWLFSPHTVHLSTSQSHSVVHLRNRLYKAFSFGELTITGAGNYRSYTMSLKVDFIFIALHKWIGRKKKCLGDNEEKNRCMYVSGY